jgi:hypothetical protein
MASCGAVRMYRKCCFFRDEWAMPIGGYRHISQRIAAQPNGAVSGSPKALTPLAGVTPSSKAGRSVAAIR